MDTLRKLEKRALEFWQLANKAVGANDRQKYLKLHREAYLQLKRQKEWLKAMEMNHE